jgi:predicted Mrr-cat superfamily restriction endonuclease
MKNAWMVRSGGGDYIELFESGLVAIGFGTPQNLSGKDREAIRHAYREHNPGISGPRASGDVGMLYRFSNEIRKGDGVLTYDPSTRKYMVGEIAGDYYFDEAANMLKYLQTRFLRLLLSLRKNTQDINHDRFQFVPVMDMTEEWNDRKLYEFFDLNDDEIHFLESMILEIE